MILFLLICKSWNRESGNRIRGVMGTRGIRMGTRGIKVEMQVIRVGMRGMVVRMLGIREKGWECGESA